MKTPKFLFGLMLLACMTIIRANAQDTTKASMKQEAKTFYGCCPSCPDMKSDKPGKCPKCGMALEKKTVKAAKSNKEDANYYCPMHPDITSSKPGKCSKCGMDLKKVEKK